jgi:subtilisin-like proprotein convertase family protein
MIRSLWIAAVALAVATSASAQSKDQQTQRLIDLQSQIELAKTKGNLRAVAPLQTEFNQISNQLGGDTPCAVGPVQEGSSAARAPAPSPMGCTPTTSNFAQVSAVAIPTGPAIVTSTVVVAGAGSRIWDVDVTTNIVHSFAADLDITIQSPAGTVVTLTTDNGGGNDNVFNGTLWDDGANPLGQVPYTANNGLVTDHAYADLTLASPLVPEESFAAFVGENPNGTWTITISDDSAGDGGSLTSWALAVTTFPQAVQTSALQSFDQPAPVAIPTGPAFVSSTLAVSGVSNRLCKAVLRTAIRHSFSADLDMTLQSPGGTIVTLSTDNGGGNDDVFNGAAWSDDANPAGQLPYTTNSGLATDHAYVNLTLASPLVVEESMGAFMGEDANGTWTLTISDDHAGDGGSIDAWGLDLTGCFCAVNADPVITPMGVTRAQGSANFRSVIANVSNAGGAGNVTVSAAPATGSGVVITGIQNNNGVISALIRAGCMATNSSTFSLTANNGSSSNVATLPVTVTPGTNPLWCQWWPR